MIEAETAARLIVEQYMDDPIIARIVEDSPEPYRAMVYETNVVDGASIDGTDYYSDIVEHIPAYCDKYYEDLDSVYEPDEAQEWADFDPDC